MNSVLTLTPEEARELERVRLKWIAELVSTKPANRKRAEQGVRLTYRAAGLREPRYFLWFDGLLEAAVGAEQLGGSAERNWMLPPGALRPRKRVQQSLRRLLEVRTWPQVVKAIGREHTQSRFEKRIVVNSAPSGRRAIPIAVAVKRTDSLQAGLHPFDPVDDSGSFDPPAVRAARQELDQSWRRFFEQQHYLLSCYLGPGVPGHPGLELLSPLFARDYPFGFLAMHEFFFRCCGLRTSAAYEGLCITAHSCAAWWPFADAALLADRPRIVHFDSEGKLHNPDGPAIVYRSGLALCAMHGKYRGFADGRHQHWSLTKRL